MVERIPVGDDAVAQVAMTTLLSKEDRHVCKPPPGFAPTSGLLWICPDCWSEFIFP